MRPRYFFSFGKQDPEPTPTFQTTIMELGSDPVIFQALLALHGNQTRYAHALLKSSLESTRGFNPQLQYLLALSYQRQHKLEKCERTLEKILQEKPPSATPIILLRSVFLRGITWQGLKEPIRAEEDFSSAYKLGMSGKPPLSLETAIQALHNLGIISIAAEDYSIAARHLKRALRIFLKPEAKDIQSSSKLIAQVQRTLGVCYIRSGEGEKAVELLSLAVSNDPGCEEYKTTLAEVLLLAKDLPVSVLDFEVRDHPLVNAFKNLSIHKASGRKRPLREALSSLNEFLSDSSKLRRFNEIGKVLRLYCLKGLGIDISDDVHRELKSLEDEIRVLESRAGDPEVYLGPPRAEKGMDQIERLKKLASWLRIEKAIALDKMGDKAVAIKILSSEIENSTASTYSVARLTLGNIQLRNENFKAALSIYSKSKNDWEAVHNLAISLARIGSIKAAEEEIEAANSLLGEIKPDSYNTLLRNRARIRAKIGDLEGARSDCVSAGDTESEKVLEIAEFFLERGKT